jgi:chemosensory pili system protein ChpA (sensor histidine kinase/response regulator)
MSETRNPIEFSGASQDIAPLAWVIDEIRGSLTAAAEALGRFVENRQDLQPLRDARNQVHQANGALQLLDMRGVVLLTEAIESALRRWEADHGDCQPGAVRSVETAIEAAIAFLEGLLAGRPNQPIRLYPYYRDMLTLARAARVHPADLVFADLSRRPAFHEIAVQPLTADQLRIRRVRFEQGLLGFLRDADDPQARALMREALDELEYMPQRGLARSFWWIVRGLLEALERDKVQVDIDLKRVLARLNLQLRRLIEGGSAVAERLMTDTLYYVGRASESVPRVAEVKQLYGLDALIPPDFEVASLTMVNAEALRGLRDALTGAKTVWSQLVSGNASEAARFTHEISMARDAANRLDVAPLATVLGAIAIAAGAAPAASASSESVGIEIASALLFVELGVDALPDLDADYAARAQSMAERIAAAAAGQPPADAAPWLAALARRAQDRLTMNAVVAETQTTLRDIEQRLDRFFRNPSQRAELPSTLPLLDQVCGVLAVLGHDDPVAALHVVQREIRKLADTASDAPTPADVFQRIAQNLGAVGFFVETLSADVEQPRGMFRFDPGSGLFSADLALGPGIGTENDDPEDSWAPALAASSPAAAAADNVEALALEHQAEAHEIAQRLVAAPLDNGALQALSRVLAQLTAEADLLDEPDLKQRTARAAQLLEILRADRQARDAGAIAALFAPVSEAAPPPSLPMPASQDAADRELLDIFVEEAREVLDDLDGQLAQLSKAPGDVSAMTTARRAFHTLKGSSRMVGLRAFGDVAWGVEQCLNLWLAQERPASDDLLGLVQAVAAQMRGWIDSIAREPAFSFDAAHWMEAAQQVREGSTGTDTAMTTAPRKTDVQMLGDLGDTDVADDELSSLQHLYVVETDVEMPTSDTDVKTIAADRVDDAAVIPAVDASIEQSSVVAGRGRAPAIPEPAADPAGHDDVRRIGPVEISHSLYAVFLSEADEAIRLLAHDIAEWRFEPQRAVDPTTVRRAHSLAGISGTVGLTPVWDIADPLDDLLQALHRVPPVGGEVALSSSDFDRIERVVERMRGMLHQFAAGLFPDDAPAEVMAVREILAQTHARQAAQFEALAAARLEPDGPPATPSSPHPDVDPGSATQPEAGDRGTEPLAAASIDNALPIEEPPAAGTDVPPADAPASAAVALDTLVDAEASDPADPAATLRVRDELDADLLPVFLAEASDLMPAVSTNLRDLAANPNDRDIARDLMRHLHTIKGSARMAGAMRLGELVHDMETRIESAMLLASVPEVIVDDLQTQHDRVLQMYDALVAPERTAGSPQEGISAATEPMAAGETAIAPNDAATPASEPAGNAAAPAAAQAVPAAQTAQAASFIRVRADVLDNLVDQAGEVSIARAKLETELSTLKGGLTDLTDNITRLRNQLREVEIQADAQIGARADRLDRESSAFDPLEYDRYTRLQELTRLLAESVEDVAMIQGSMVKGLQLADTDLTAQSRLMRELQQQLLRVRLVPFASISDRLYRVARQAAKELDKRVNLEIRGGSTEIDRGVLERMGGPFEHIVRNAIVHGLESPRQRTEAGKRETGELTIEVRQEGNEIIVVCADDGAGLSLDRIRARAIERDLLTDDQPVTDRELMELIFTPGFSTATEVTELAGRGVGMDVVRNELASFGGRIALSTEAGRGTRFTLYLPLTLAVTQVVLATVGHRRYALPSGMVEQVRRFKPAALEQALRQGETEAPGIGNVVLRPLAQLLGEDVVLHQGRQAPIVVLRAGEDRLAVSADDVSSTQEVVVKSVGAQVSRLAGILGATILGNGEIVLIVNPVQLISRSPEPWQPMAAALPDAIPETAVEAASAQERLAQGDSGAGQARGLIMVVDDSLTVRRVTQRLLERNGYDVMLAKDGVDALRQLQDAVPDVMLVDIEMPRMDGFDLTRNVRSAESTREVPIIMITSRTAEKHRTVALDLGVNEYLGKPYREEQLLGLIGDYIARRATAH